MPVALTGADGFTGRYVAEELSRRGVSWVALEGDITDPHAMDQAVADTPFDRLIHLATIAFAGGTDLNAFYNVNHTGTFNLLQSVARHRPGAVCVLASSATIYGPSASGMVDETALPNPSNHYAVSKYAMELGSALWHGVLDIRVARPFNYTGVGREAHYLIPKITAHLRRAHRSSNWATLRSSGNSGMCALLRARTAIWLASTSAACSSIWQQVD